MEASYLLKMVEDALCNLFSLLMSFSVTTITRPVGSVMLQKREEKKQKNMSAQKIRGKIGKYGGFRNSEYGRGCLL